MRDLFIESSSDLPEDAQPSFVRHTVALFLHRLGDREQADISGGAPGKDCTSDAERLDVHNGLLLSALWDAAFDRGLATFDDEGQPQFSPSLSDSARAELRWQDPIPLTDKHRKRLIWHRTNLFVSQGGA